ncbi:phage tail fiber protein [Klebsiella michiganensis]|uniref:phage tail fiber domain-containing protein n=1 Tax=Klebsiella michiganensis TaxID=1134687 RepID=UPI002E7B35D3|nr:phage tail fiber protein [Klebsiella michiganensis]MEE1968017.1 phage tail fiber protein [Klebsiella michiganensis]
MSVPNQTPYNIYTANGLSTVFAYEFYLISASDIQVTINGNEVTSGYTVSGVGNTGGGEVTFLTAPANGATVIFERVTPTYRLTDYQDNGDLLADTVNKDFDRLWMAIQRAFIYLGVALTRPLFGGGPFNANGYRIENVADPINDQDVATKKFVVDNGKTNLSRTLRVPDSSIPELPSLDQLEGKILAFVNKRPIGVLPESGSAADVMIELSSVDGLKWLGKCSSIVSLRATEPTYDKQSITLHRAVPDGAIIDAVFFYDASDSTSEDDGYRIIVTPGGARWVTDCADGIDLRLGGLLADGSNFGAAANKIIRGEVKKIIDSSTSFVRIVQIIKVPHPTYLSKNAYYNLEETIYMPSFMGFTCAGWIDVRTSLTSHALWVRNDEEIFPGLKFSMGGYVSLQGFGAVRNANGRLRLLGPGVSESEGAGIAVGTPNVPVANASEINTRDICVSGIHVSGFLYGVGFYGYDSYIITFEFCEISRCGYPIAGLAINKQNSGERILFRSCTIGGTGHNIYWNLVGWNITYDNCSIDYAGAAMLYLGNGARGCVFRFTNGTFIEGFGTRLVSQDTTSDSWEYDGGRKNKLLFHSAFINAQKKAGEFSSRRQIFASSSDMLGHVELVDTEVRWPDVESEPHVALLGYNDATATRIRGFFRNANTPYDQCLMRYGDSLNAGLYRLSGNEGDPVSLDAATNMTFSLTGGMTATYGGIDPDDGLVFVNLTATAVTDSLEIRNQSLRVPVNRFNQIFSALSMKMSAVTAGAVTLSTKLYYYGKPTFTTTLTNNVYQTLRAFDFLGSSTGYERNISTLLTAEDTPLTTEKYVGVQTYCEVGYQYALGTLKASPAIRVSGYAGTMQIKLPVYWLPKGTEANPTSD